MRSYKQHEVHQEETTGDKSTQKTLEICINPVLVSFLTACDTFLHSNSIVTKL